MSDIDKRIERVRELVGKTYQYEALKVLAAQSIMPIISEVERLKTELELIHKRLVESVEEEQQKHQQLYSVQAELSKAQEKIKELERRVYIAEEGADR